MKRLAVAVVLAFGGAASAEPPVREHDIVLEDYFDLAFITTCVLSPDATRIAYTEMRWEPENDGRNTDLWVVDVASKRRTRLTFDPAADANPAWSADGQWIYFTSARSIGAGDDPPGNGRTQVWRVPPAGGAPSAVTREGDGVQAFELSRDGRRLYYAVGAEYVEDDRWKSLRESFDGLDYGHGTVTNSRIWRLDLESWRVEKLVDEQRVIGAFTVTPDERRIAMITTPTEELISNEGWSRIDVYDAITGVVATVPDRLFREEAPSPYGWIDSLAWTDDGDALAFRVDFDGYPGQIVVAEFTGDGDITVSPVARPNEASVVGVMRWRPGTRDLCFAAEDHARTRVYRVRDIEGGKQGGAAVLTPGDVTVGSFSLDETGRVLAVEMSDPSNMTDLYTLSASGGEATYERVTDINPQVSTWKLPQISVVSWTSPDGTAVEGVLELPPDYEPGDGPLPLMVEIHGGPTSSTPFALRFWIYGRTLFPARGWALLSPNYRGSTGYGDRFLTDLIGNENDIEVKDIIAGVDALIERGLADPDRLACMGWSNGGYLTNCLIAHDERFKAASSGAGVFDVTMQWSIEDTPGHVINYAEGLPWANPAAMRRMSPLYQADRIATPTLIHVGENDARVPKEHSIALHRALHHYLDVPCELIIYPGEGHGLTTYTHRKAKLEWDVAWMEYHVLGKEREAATDTNGQRAE